MDIVVIGGGIAGNTAASTIRRHNSRAHLTIISQEAFPLYSACALPHYLARRLTRDRVFLKSLHDYQRDGIQTILGEKVEHIDSHNRQVFLAKQTIPYDKLVIATGSEVVIPPIKGIEKEGVFTFRSLTDADGVYNWAGERAVVIGSGLIGIEVAIALRKRGYHVHIVEMMDWILPRTLDIQPALLVKELLENNNINVSVRKRVDGIVGNGKVAGVVSDEQEIACDTVILATGMKPNIELARKVGLDVGRLGGIEVDSRMMSSIPSVYACGDCVETADLVSGEEALNLLWSNARQQAEIAGSNCLGKERQYHGSMNITGLDIFDTEAVSIGITSATTSPEKADTVEVIEKNSKKGYFRLLINDGFLVGVQGIGHINDLGLLLGAMLRKENLGKRKQGSAEFLLHMWWQHKINQYYHS